MVRIRFRFVVGRLQFRSSIGVFCFHTVCCVWVCVSIYVWVSRTFAAFADLTGMPALSISLDDAKLDSDLVWCVYARESESESQRVSESHAHSLHTHARTHTHTHTHAHTHTHTRAPTPCTAAHTPVTASPDTRQTHRNTHTPIHTNSISSPARQAA